MSNIKNATMNILYLAHRIPFPPNKGDKLRAFREIEHLSMHHRVWCACFVDDARDLEHVDSLRRYCEDVAAIRLRPAVALSRGLWGLSTGSTLTESYYRHRTMHDVLAAWQRRIGFDAVVAFSSGMARYALGVPAMRRVLDMCDRDSVKWLDYARAARGLRRYVYRREGHKLNAAERRWINEFDATVLISRAEAATLADDNQPTSSIPSLSPAFRTQERRAGSARRGGPVHEEEFDANRSINGTAGRARPTMLARVHIVSNGVVIPRDSMAVDRDGSQHEAPPRRVGYARHGGSERDEHVDGIRPINRSAGGTCLTSCALRHGMRPAPVIGFIGVMDYRPNVDGVVWFVENCWRRIRERTPGAVFRVAGRSPTRCVRKLSRVDGVIVVGEVPDAFEEISRWDVSVAPLRIARGIQNKVLEAMAAAKPVVLTREAATGVNARHGEHWLVADGAPEFSETVVNLLYDAEARDRLGHSARAFVQTNHRWDVEMVKFERIVTGMAETGATDVLGAAHEADEAARLPVECSPSWSARSD